MSITIEALIPHRPPMLWVNGLTSYTETAAAANACFNAGDFAVADGSVLETALVECVAQTVAAAMACRKPGNATFRTPHSALRTDTTGMLVSISGFRVQSRPAVGKPLQIETQEIKRFGSMLLVSGRISCEGRAIASGELTLYV